jgi:Entner-Doudoroff aldolase
MSSISFPDHFRAERASAILRCDDADTAALAMEAAIAGGFSIVEFTLTIPKAFDLICDFSKRPGITVGAGTVLSPDDAEAAVAAGAAFLVSPVYDPEVVDAASRLGRPVMPGIHTPTEALAAYRRGAQLQKVFPAPAGGPVWIRSTLAPLPFLRLVPTNGVDEHNVRDFFAAGAWAVGFTTALFEPAALAAKDRGRITERARLLRDRVRG